MPYCAEQGRAACAHSTTAPAAQRSQHRHLSLPASPVNHVPASRCARSWCNRGNSARSFAPSSCCCACILSKKGGCPRSAATCLEAMPCCGVLGDECLGTIWLLKTYSRKPIPTCVSSSSTPTVEAERYTHPLAETSSHHSKPVAPQLVGSVRPLFPCCFPSPSLPHLFPTFPKTRLASILSRTPPSSPTSLPIPIPIPHTPTSHAFHPSPSPPFSRISAVRPTSRTQRHGSR